MFVLSMCLRLKLQRRKIVEIISQCIHVYQTIVLYILNILQFICLLKLNEAGEKKKVLDICLKIFQNFFSLF